MLDFCQINKNELTKNLNFSCIQIVIPFCFSVDVVKMTHCDFSEASFQLNSVNVLLVGQVYTDIILTVDHFPEEDSKLRASGTQQRRGGNCLNTAEVLCQFPRTNIFLMSALGPREESM